MKSKKNDKFHRNLQVFFIKVTNFIFVHLVDPYAKIYCGAVRICQAYGNIAECVFQNV